MMPSRNTLDSCNWTVERRSIAEDGLQGCKKIQSTPKLPPYRDSKAVQPGARAHRSLIQRSFTELISAVFAVIPSWLAINYLKIHNKHLLVLGCSIVMAADIGAYIVGKLFGKHKLTTISPGKTWEGVFGGYIGSLLVCAIYMVICNINLKLPNILSLLLLTSVTFIFSVVGDLFESLLKRVANVKDSGTILPGHGGILDRIDSFCSGIPMFLLIFLILDKYILL